jgi:nicotinamidase-related amidase
MSADFELDPKDTAFVFIEYQNEFTTEGGKLHGAVKECMESTNSKYIQVLYVVCVWI